MAWWKRVMGLGGRSNQGTRGTDLDRLGSAGPRSDLGGLDLRGAQARGISLTEVKLTGANLSGADLRNANLGRTDLRLASVDWVPPST